MKIPVLLNNLIARDDQISSVVTGGIAAISPWIQRSLLPFFSEYTDHSLTHVEEVIETANGLIAEDAQSLLSSMDAAVLVLAICLHDCAMHLTEEGFYSLVAPGSQWKPIPGLDTKAWSDLWEEFLSDAKRFDGRTLTKIFGDTIPVRRPPTNPLDLTKRDRQLMGEFIRRYHARLAHEIAIYGIPAVDGKSVPLIHTNSEKARWIGDLAGLVARSHGINLRSAFPYIEKHYHLRDFNGTHVIYLMVLLRIADYLQIQARRAPTEVLEVRKLTSPLSVGEWKVHASVRNIDQAGADPEAINVTADPPDVVSFIRLREWIDGIQGELDSSWAVLGEIYGRFSQNKLDKLGIKLRRITSNLDDIATYSAHTKYVPAQVSFEAASADLLKLLVGPLYGEDESIGLRELIQNAIDAVLEYDTFVAANPQFSKEPRVEGAADVTAHLARTGN